MQRIWGDRTPLLKDVRPVLDLLIEATEGTDWGDALTEQAQMVCDISGSCWYVSLVLSGAAAPAPDWIPNPCAALVTRENVLPYGTLLLWLDEQVGVISSIEYSAIEMADVDHYPRVGELEIDRDFPSDFEIACSAKRGARAHRAAWRTGRANEASDSSSTIWYVGLDGEARKRKIDGPSTEGPV